MRILFLILLTLSAGIVSAQGISVSGTLTDAESGEALIGATIVEKGTTNGTITDIDGNYQVTVTDPAAVLVFSFVGYQSQEVTINNRTTINVALSVDIEALDEVVVVGYGTQTKKDLTSAITTLKSEEITKTPASTAMNALQGKVAGVQIVTSGAPGAGPSVRIRGIGTLEGGSSPLYVVDGMFMTDINFLNPSDIKTISVLKDASALAIFGVRAANGVVLVETKQGAYDEKVSFTYDGYWGAQVPQNILEMANTPQFVDYALATGSSADASFVANAFQRYGRSRTNTDYPAIDTDWYDEVMKSYAPIQSHNLSASGGSKNARYSVGVGYFNQEGLVKEVNNSYERYNFRTRVDANIEEWLNVGTNFNVTQSEQHVAPSSIWFNTYFAVPLIPVYDETNTQAYPYQLGNARNIGYRGRQNPYFNMLYNDDQNLSTRIVGNVFAELELIPNTLKFKTTYNYNFNSLNVRNIDFEYNDGTTFNQSSLYKANNTTANTIWDNTLTYTQNFGAHSFTAMAGYSYRVDKYNSLYVRGDSLNVNPNFGNEELWYYSNPAEEIVRESSGDGGAYFYGVSYLGRLAYNYDDRYLVYSTLRRDGTNKFQKTWGVFPTVGAGWVISEESFFDVRLIDFLKIRGSWGKLGNDNISPAVGQPTYDNRILAIDDQLESGVVAVKQFSLIDRWETVVETNVGITSTMLNGRLSFDADYYIRDTEDAVLTVILPLVRSNIRKNAATFRNKGFEFSADWNDEISNNLKYNVGLNFATLKNEVTGLAGQQYLDAGSAEFRQRSIIGSPIEAFYGYEVEGVFQNEAEIENSGYNEQFITDASLVPGDFKFKDQNGDGFIDDLDRVVLGSYLPKLTYGFNLGINYKKIELSANFQGQSGNKILNRKRGEIIFTTDANIDAELASNLWTGEGTSNKYPSAAGLRKGYNQAMSDYFVEDGSYFRIQNVRFTYNFGGGTLFGKNMPDAKFILTAEKPVTVFNYNGFNPEVAGGIDRQTYPIPAIYTAGLNLKF